MDSSSDPLIIISMDGFRPDFLGRNLTPNIDYLGKKNLLPFWTFISDPKLKKQSCKQTDIQLQFDGEMNRRTDGRTDGRADRWTDEQIDGRKNRRADIQTDRQTDEQTDGQLDIQL